MRRLREAESLDCDGVSREEESDGTRLRWIHDRLPFGSGGGV